MELYKNRQIAFKQQSDALKKKYKALGASRLLVFLGIVYCFYLSVSRAETVYFYFILALVVLFIVLLHFHTKLSWKLRYVKALEEINADEYEFVVNDVCKFEGGAEFNEADHPYTADLDIFGHKSLYQFLNRTHSFGGRSKLARLLKTHLKQEDILANQEAIAELASKVEWRQEISAYSKISNLDKDTFERLNTWTKSAGTTLSKFTTIVSFAFPILLAVNIAMYFIADHNVLWGYMVSTIFTLNLVFALSKVTKIQGELAGVEKIHETISSYSEIVEIIEKESFVSKKLKSLHQSLNSEKFKTSKELKLLSRHFGQLETIGNVFVLITLNGFFQYHVHVLRSFLKWKNTNVKLLQVAIDVVAEIEALNSLANFAYNNTDYTYPQLNTNGKMQFTNLGHPLLNKKKRVCNTIDFNNQHFVILTGSNMSGKSTFLRTIGVNLVLASIGAPICATQATFFPLPLLVTMRLTDSLDDSESYFYAEVKRLKMIIEEVQKGPCFVLLDEILRGTNSDDKRSGTIGVILKLIREKTFGLIATHDLEVCEITHTYPDTLTNKCFEVEIKENDLYFDYKIRDGVCQNKNATFIMKKMEIID